MPEESKVGKKLSDLTTRRVIMVVLAMLFSVPLFDTTSYIAPDSSYEFGLYLISAFDPGSEALILLLTVISRMKHKLIRLLF